MRAGLLFAVLIALVKVLNYQLLVAGYQVLHLVHHLQLFSLFQTPESLINRSLFEFHLLFVVPCSLYGIAVFVCHQ